MEEQDKHTQSCHPDRILYALGIYVDIKKWF